MRDVFQDLSAELLADGLMIRFRASGQSMSPTIRDGEAITVAPVSVADVRRGDILLYQRGRKLLAHRVVSIDRQRARSSGLILRGDASFTDDEPIAAAQVLGRVVSVERDGRELALAGRGARLRHNAGKASARLKGLVRVASFARLFRARFARP